MPPGSRVVRWGYPLLGAGLFALYLPTLARGATFTDGPELVTAVFTLGVAHPTGYPVFILVGHLFCKLLALPILVCVKIEILNALCGAAAAVFAAHTARILTLLGQRRDGAGIPIEADLGGLAAGAMLGIAPLVWEEVRIPEVYAMHLFLASWAGYLWARFEATQRTVYVVAAALPMGIGLAHHVTMVYMLPAAFIYLMVRRPSFFVTWLAYPPVRFLRLFKKDLLASRRFEGWWGFPVACLVGFLPLLSYGFLIWANKHTAGIPWGDPHDWDSLYGHFTGRQYQGFMTSLDRAGHLTRIKQIAPLFDAQFLPEGTALFFTGLFFAFRRAPKLSVFFLAYLLFNLAHGAHYGVGDYSTYYIPAAYACTVFMGAGLAGLLELARTRPAAERAWMSFAVLAIMLGGTALSIILYAKLTNRLPGAVASHPWAFGVPFALLSAAAVAAASRASRTPGWPMPLSRRGPLSGPLPEHTLPAVILAGLGISLVPIAAVRAHDYMGEAVIGESYGAEVAAGLPPGTVFMTQGDGFLFTMWYEQHVHGRAIDAATVDMGNTRTPWYQHYVFTRNPGACDPLSAANLADPKAFADRCDTYAKRIALGTSDSWVSLGFAGNRRPYPGVPASTAPILRAVDPQCADKKWHDDHVAKECRCWGYGKSSGAQEGTLEEDCVESAEEGGVVPRELVELYAQRIIEDMIDERPVYERNIFTQTGGGPTNPRGWDGPTYQRISADWTLLSRGRFNQVLWFDDVKNHDACADTFHPIRPRPLLRPRTRLPGQDRRRPYRPNPRPQLFHASYLIPAPTGNDDDATRAISAGDPLYMKLDWFERFYWDATKPEKRGAPVHHGMRFCVYDPDGQKLASREAISGDKDPVPLLAQGAAKKPGVYHVSACSVGEVGDKPLPLGDDKKCSWTVLEYDFTVKMERRP